MTQREPALVTPFWVRLASETSFSAGWLLIAFPAVLYPLYLALEALFGRGLAAATDFSGDIESWVVPFWVTDLGYITMMGTYVARGTLRDFEALRPVLTGGDAAYATLREQLTQFHRRRLWIGGFLGLVLFCLTSELAAGRWTRLVAGEWSLRAICIVAAGAAVWIVGIRATVYVIDAARLYSRIGEQHVEVNLLDLGPLSPLTRHGLRIVLLCAISVAATAVLWLVATEAAPSVFGSPMTALLLACLCSCIPSPAHPQTA